MPNVLKYEFKDYDVNGKLIGYNKGEIYLSPEPSTNNQYKAKETILNDGVVEDEGYRTDFSRSDVQDGVTGFNNGIYPW